MMVPVRVIAEQMGVWHLEQFAQEVTSMKRVRWRWTTILTVVMMLLATYSSPRSEAADWLTKGGTPLRQSVVPEMTGLMQVEEAWPQPADVGPNSGSVPHRVPLCGPFPLFVAVVGEGERQRREAVSRPEIRVLRWKEK